MSNNIVVFPSFADNEVRPYEMRQLVSALEQRFQGLEQDTFLTIGGEELTLADLDARYAPNPHDHSESDIVDLQAYLTTINGQSIFALNDVNGSPANNDIMVWNAGTGSFELTPFTVVGNALNSLSDVHVPGPTNGQVLTYVTANSRWQAATPASGSGFGAQDEFVALDAFGLSYSVWWGQALQRLEMYNDSTATSGGFWFNFQSGHLEPSVRIGVNNDTAFLLQTDAGIRIFNGLSHRIYDSTDADYADFAHDGTDFNTVLVGTTDWNVTGLTNFAIDGNYSGLSFGGILEADLLDKSDAETVTGAWTFSGTTVVPEATVTDHEAAIDHDALLNFVANEHIDWTVDAVTVDVHANNISEASVTQHEAALSITESQISDLQAYLTSVLAADVDSEAATDGWVLTADGLGGAAWEAVSSGSGLPADPDVDALLFWDDSETGVEATWITSIPDSFVTESSVTQHQAAIDHDALLNFVAAEHIDWSVTGAEDVHADRISEASVTQHEAALSITESQISDLQAYLTSVLAANVNSEAATDGWVLTADGAGNAAWEAVPAGGLPADPNVDAILFWDDSDTGSELEWITEIPDSFLSDNVPLINAANVFTNQFGLTLSHVNAPLFSWNETGAPADEKIWRAGLLGSEWLLFTATDAGGIAETALSIARTGTHVDQIDLFADEVRVRSDGSAALLTIGPDTTTPISIQQGNRGITQEASSSVSLDINAIPLDGTGSASVRIGRSTNTTGINQLTVLRGNNSTTSAVRLLGKGSTASGGHIYISESAAANSLSAGTGQLWVRNDTPNTLMFSDDAGNDCVAINNSGITLPTSSLMSWPSGATLPADRLVLWPGYTIGIESSTMYFHTGGNNFRWYGEGQDPDSGTSHIMALEAPNNGLDDDVTLHIRADDFAGLILDGDYDNSSGEPGGAYAQFKQDGGAVWGAIAIVQSDEIIPGVTYTGGAANAFVFATLGSHFRWVTGGVQRALLSTAGNFVATGNVTAGSDLRLKDNIRVIENALDKVDRLRGVTFDRIDIEGDARYTGLIAQELEPELPEAVLTDEDGYKSIAYGNVVGLLVEAIKELRAEVRRLAA